MMFREAVTIPVPVAAAESRLAARLAVDRLQPQATQSNAEAAEILLRAGFGPISKQVTVLTLPPTLRDDTVVFPIRWKATGPAKGLFPELDANLELSPTAGKDGAAMTEVIFIGSYRLPLGTVGKAIDHTALKHAAQATIRCFLRHLPPVLDPKPARADSDTTEVAATPYAEPT